MRLWTPLIVLITSTLSWALHESDVGVIDWHKSLVGVPQVYTPGTAPLMHRVKGKTSKSVILSVTDKNVLAALDPVSGGVTWRHVFDDSDPVVSYHKYEDAVVALSGPGSSTVRMFESLTGFILFERKLYNDSQGPTSAFGTHVAFAPEMAELNVLTGGHTVTRLNGKSGGKTLWTWRSEDQGSLVTYLQLVNTAEAVYAIGVAKEFASYTVHLTAIDPITGAELASRRVPSDVTDPSQIMALTNGDQRAVVWLEKGKLKSIPLEPKLLARPLQANDADVEELLDITLANQGMLVVKKTNGAGRIVKLSEKEPGVTDTVWDFEVPSAPALYSGGLDKDGKPYIARLYWSITFKKVTVDVFTPHFTLVTGFTIPFDTDRYGKIEHFHMDAAVPGGWTVLTRLVLTTSTGAIQFWQQEDLKWTRDEALAHIAAAEFVELPERVAASSSSTSPSTSRLQRQLRDARQLPQYVYRFAKRFATGAYASATSPASEVGVFRDAFGFRQVIVTATARGVVYGLDSSNGAVLWSRLYEDKDGAVTPVKVFTLKTVSDGETPQVVVVAQRKTPQGQTHTVLYHLDALTGKDMRRKFDKGEPLIGFVAVKKPLADAFLLDADTRVVVLVDESLDYTIFPETKASEVTFATYATSLYFPLLEHGRLSGYTLGSDNAYPAWTIPATHGDSIDALIPLSRGPIASLGKVVADRKTLYKYLNPRLVGVLTSGASGCGVSVVDAAKGTVLYHARVPAVRGVCDVHASLTEHWLVYSYYEGEAAGSGVMGYRVVTVEFYEGHAPDEKTGSAELSAFDTGLLNYTTYEQAYAYPQPITALATTRTKHGITMKDLIVARADGKIHSLQRRLLDPRRPKHKPTAQDAEELLIQYEPVLPDDPKRILSHKYEITNTAKIITSPALLESTSLVYAYGLDMFLTRVSPSGTFDVLSEGFNKIQLVLTISALAIGLVVTRPMVRRKKLRERWYS
ncbi:hypothetical protein GGF50DRAFT_131591 [Schizophyllum commune]